jgi:hypothetical protein
MIWLMVMLMPCSRLSMVLLSLLPTYLPACLRADRLLTLYSLITNVYGLDHEGYQLYWWITIR